MTHSYTIGSVQIAFDKKPFPQQFALMNKVIQALRKGENALLESPTGTGKTLAILSSSLAWQKFEYENELEIRKKIETESKSPEEEIPPSPPKRSKYFSDQANEDSDFDEDFEMPRKTKNVTIQYETEISDTIEPSFTKKRKLYTIRKETIFIASRTHSQLKQIVSEMKRLPKELRDGINMVVLGSRKNYCVNPSITKKKKFEAPAVRNEMCKQLIARKIPQCKYYSNSNKVTNYRDRIMDIEELADLAASKTHCPYFVTKHLVTRGGANVILCPYNYLISPSIRTSMGLDGRIPGSVIIIDEAHNLEDVARDAASIDITISKCSQVLEEMQMFLDIPKYHDIIEFAQSMTSWCHEIAHGSTTPIIYSGPEAVVMLHKATGLCMEKILKLRKALRSSNATTEGSDDVDEGPAQETMSDFTVKFLDSILLVLEFLFSGDGQHAKDYRIVAREEQVSFWCMNAALALKPLADLCRSIILTSGTLSPLKAFEAELGIKFAQQLEAPHIIKVDRQVFSSVISHVGPTQLECTYANQKNPAYITALGNCIIQHCNIVPNGVLCFFPSYGFLKSCTAFWQKSPLWAEMNLAKKVFVERSDEDIEKQIASYKSLAAQQQGGVFLCVFRGKLSEGIDFRDDTARAVLICGIPYPNVSDPKIKLKMEWQNMNARYSENVVSGREWYSLQAFRALNQAIGRCIRHRNDYGAILFLDHRFTIESNRKHLSKWIQQCIQTSTSPLAQRSLSTFFKMHHDQQVLSTT